MNDNALGNGLGAGLLIGSLVLVLLELGLNIYAAIDAGRRPDWAFRQAGTDKSLWIGLPGGAAVATLICCACLSVVGAGVGIVLLIPAGMWLFSFRGKVEAEERQGPRYGGYGPPPGFGGPPPGYGPPPGFGGPPPGYGGPPPGFGGPPPPGYGPPPGFGQGPPGSGDGPPAY